MTTKRTCEECGAELPANAPQGLCPGCLAKMGLALLPTAVMPKSDFLIERTGMMIGRYKLLEKIGEGGFGVVFMAEQVEPVQRKVALKIIKAGMDTREVIARFEAERQAIALMDHPNIARALDAGATEAGRPYFVMELVRGIPITDYCDQKQLPTRERLQLFIKVCQAVQHAHQKGVIHRDIKPTNVLVTEHDGEPVPKVIDFGVAKALGQKLTEKTLFTAFHHLIGTPAYMSPEQAALSGLDVDTRADVYSLGVLLYELLTGVTPFDGDTFRKAGLDEIRQMIRETEPPKPSTRLQTLGEKLTAIAKHRHIEPAALTRLVRGDLDWIVMKCLEKDRKRRYETANGLAADVERHLGSEPVVACPPDNFYRFQKLVGRHKIAFTTVGAVVASLVIGLGIATWFFIKENEARQIAVASQKEQARLFQEAEREKKAAQMEANRSDQVARYLKNILDDIAPSLAKGCTKKYALDVLTRVDARVANELHDQQDVEAVVRISLAEVQKGLGQYAEAETNLNKVLVIRKKLFGAAHSEVATTLGKKAELYRIQKKWAEAEALSRETVSLWEQLSRNSPTNENICAELGHSQWDLGYILAESDRSEAAIEVIQSALNVFGKAAGDFPDNPYFRQEQAFSHRTLGDLLNSPGNFDKLDRHYRAAIDLYATLKADVPDNVFYYAEEAYVTWMLATKLEQAGRPAASVAAYRQALTLHEQAIARFPKQADLEQRRDSIRADLATLLTAQGKQTEVEALLRERAPGSLVQPPVKNPGADKVLPLVMMTDVPLSFAIKNLARQANLNITFDEGIPNETRATRGSNASEAIVNIRWENLTARQALDKLLAERGLVMAEDPQTETTRILAADAAASREMAPLTMVGKPVSKTMRLPLLAGGEIELPPSTKHGPLLLDFFASWCPYCRQATPLVAHIASDYAARGVRHVAVNQGETPETIHLYLARAKLEIPVALDWKCGFAGTFRITSFPTIVIVDQSNVIRYVHVGISPELGDELRRELDEVLKSQAEQEQSSRAPDQGGSPESAIKKK